MNFLVVNTDYPHFLHWLYAQSPGLEGKSYVEQMQVRNDSLFGVADFYSSNLRKLGYEAYDIHANNEFMQKAWAREHGTRLAESTPMQQRWQAAFQQARRPATRTPLRYLKPLLRPLVRGLDNQQTWSNDILAAQIKHYKPDVVLNHAMSGISSRFLREMKPYMRLLVGQHAATGFSADGDFSCYDVVVSSFQPTVDFFRRKGIPAEINRMGFEPRVLSLLKKENRIYDVTFIGSFYDVHSSRVAFLEQLCVQFERITVWGPDLDNLSPTSPIRKCYVGPAWGRDMYQILRNSRVTLNHHGDIPPYANNMRLFEATGVGALLITDWKPNLGEIFEPDKEVVAYRTPEECAELIRYYLEHEDERQAVACAGQARTLRDHTYYHRMQEFVDIINRYL